ncbi:hypothetical protein [Cryptosporangium aurantiacum]|uniref:Uncharacterized protein n=1 Tax=Cryptosporangium aurantiacum TaxID=134849 RepID=A0A1M7I985_9ACTN|nr:hypothetical protein [Cryptosporangium aurantiacum]SHM37168.1 hypothetical protein SAMN05443668_101428 [Cryptosporangium aurantiacum]
MNANDARIGRVYVAQKGSNVPDTSPNAGPPRANSYDLIVQLEAGNVIGQSMANYTVHFTAIDENKAQPEAGLTPADLKEEFTAPGWQPQGTDFVRTGTGEPVGVLRLPVTIPAGLTGRFHYNVEFVNAGFQVVDLAQSEAFILV